MAAAGYKVPLRERRDVHAPAEKLAGTGHADADDRRPTSPFFILLIGNEPAVRVVGGSRGDALHLVGVNPKLHKATMLDIRATRAGTATRSTQPARRAARPPRPMRSVACVGVHVNYAVDVDFDGFTVARRRSRRLHAERAVRDARLGLRRFFSAGVQHMTGDAALRLLA